VNDLDQGQSAQRFPQHEGNEHKDLESWLLSQFELFSSLSRLSFTEWATEFALFGPRWPAVFCFEFLASI